MPVPIIAAGAAAVAARLATKKLAKEAAKKAASKTAQIAKNSVKTKPARKQVGNPPDSTKSLEKTASSFYRTWNPETGMEDGLRAAGKLRDARAARSKKPTGSGKASKRPAPASIPARTPKTTARKTVRINSAKTVRVVKVNPKKK